MLRFGLLFLVLMPTLVCKASPSPRDCELFHVFSDIVTVIITLIPCKMYRLQLHITTNLKENADFREYLLIILQIIIIFHILPILF